MIHHFEKNMCAGLFSGYSCTEWLTSNLFGCGEFSVLRRIIICEAFGIWIWIQDVHLDLISWSGYLNGGGGRASPAPAQRFGRGCRHSVEGQSKPPTPPLWCCYLAKDLETFVEEKKDIKGLNIFHFIWAKIWELKKRINHKKNCLLRDARDMDIILGYYVGLANTWKYANHIFIT